jgi:hypothetical protein
MSSPCVVTLQRTDLIVDESHSRQLDMLAQDDEPNELSPVEDTNLTESSHAGLVVWEFSDDEDGHVADEW